VNKYYVVVAALKALADDGEIDNKVVQLAIKKYNIDAEKPNPLKV
jgi:pyruvate dehydrogenase E1 component